MSACIFAGPTLPPGDPARACSATWLPPAKHGDVYRAVSLLRPRALGIVDGYFQWVPSVWHKEILWAIHQGVHVFGAASMGALRAAELTPLGMRGVGRIFEAYRSGLLDRSGDGPFEDDDEVAVVHGPPESGYIAASDAMVNIRCTLAAAEQAGVISAATRGRLVALAKAMYFPERSYPSLLKRARAEALAENELAALESWLPSGRVDQKRVDALAMIETMQDLLAQDLAPAKPRFAFEHTTFWELAFAGARPATVHDTEEARVLDELRLDGTRWDALWSEALKSVVSDDRAHAASSPEELASKLAAHPDDPREVERILIEAERVNALRRVREETPRAIVERQMLARMQENGDYERLRPRAEDKVARIAMRPELPDAGEFSDLQLLQLRDWYFSQALGTDMPDDIEECVHAWGYADLAHFHRAIFSEYVYRQMTDPAGEP